MSISGMAGAKARQPRHQPLGGEGGQHRHPHRAAFPVALQALGGLVHGIEGLAQGRQVGLAGLGQRQAAVVAPEEGLAQVLLQCDFT